MTSLDEQLNQLAERGTKRSIDAVLGAVERDLAASRSDRSPFVPKQLEETDVMNLPDLTLPAPPHLRHRRLVFAAAILAVVASAALLVRTLVNDAGSLTPPASSSPVVTLPPGLDKSSPVTAESNDPDYSYRLTPDVEIGWNSVGNGPTSMCWRTPVEQGCGPEAAPGVDPIPVPVSADQSVAIVAVGADYAKGTTVEFTLADGTVLSSPVEWSDDPITIGSARVDVPQELIVSTAAVN